MIRFRIAGITRAGVMSHEKSSGIRLSFIMLLYNAIRHHGTQALSPQGWQHAPPVPVVQRCP